MTPSGRYGRAVARACDIGVALVVLAAAQYYGGDYDLLLGGLMALSLLARRRFPATVMAVVLALGVAQFVLYDLPDLPLASAPASYDVAVLFAMMSVVHHSRTTWMPYLAGAVVLLATATGTVGVPALGIEPFAEPESLLIFWGLTLTVWLTAFALHTRRLYAESQAARARHAEREQEQRVRLAAARERAEIARELHDVVAHSLAVMILQGRRRRGRAAEVAGHGGVRAEDDRRHGPGRDRRHAPHRPGAARGEPGLRRRRPATAPGHPRRDPGRRRTRTGRRAHRGRVGRGRRGRLSPAEEMTAFRIVQECLTNVLRHAGAGAGVDIRLHEEQGTLLIDVVDDGAGALVGRGAGGRSGGNGLVGMRERVELAGGAFEAGPRLGSGWHVRASIPTRTK
ncbi:hypothetical protein GCM10023238_26140 [Streptomyces heliomycini]